MSEIVPDSRTLSSKPSSSILELIEQNQAAGSSIQKTISEALASISESERKTKSSNITEEVEEELSTDYSSYFEDESTLKEKSFQAVLPSVSHRRKSLKSSSRKKSLQREISSETSEMSDFEKEKKDFETSSHSLFSDTHSFSRFTLEMVNQYMEEENVRDRHKKALLKAKEKALIDKARKKMEELSDKAQDDKMPDVKKKKKAILSKLKERRAEIEQMRENLKIAEKERSFLIEEQKVLLKSKRSSTEVNDSTGVESEVDNISQVEVLQGLKKLDKGKRHLTNKERKFADRKPIPEASPIPHKDQDNAEAENKTNVTNSEDDSIPTQMSQSKVSTVRSVSNLSRSRHYSRSDSENESAKDAHETMSTMSEHSDVEARIAALSVKLNNRMKTAARLKKQQKKDRKEMLRNQEVTLIKQIEKYEQLITEGLAEIASEKSEASNDSFSKPKIKSPISNKAEKRPASPRTPPMITPEMPSLSSLSLVEDETKQSKSLSLAEDESKQSKSLSNAEDESKQFSKSVSLVEDDSKQDSEGVETPSGSTSTIVVSPRKTMSPKASEISEAIEEANSSAVSSKSSSPTSKKIQIAEGKVPEVTSLPSPEKSRPSEASVSQKKSEYSSQFDSKSLASEGAKGTERQLLPVRNVSDKLVDSITEKLWLDIIQETKTQFSPVKSAQLPTDEPKLSSSKTSPRSRSHEFTLAFDVNSSSEESSSTPVKPGEEDVDTDDNKEIVENEFMDDDFGLSSIRQEAEILRLQQLKVEEEIAALQRENLQHASNVPDKPPPPYQPPDSSVPSTSLNVPPPRPEKPPQVKVVVPNKKDEILDIIEKFVNIIHQAKVDGLDLTKLIFDSKFVEVPEDYTESEKESFLMYNNMIFSVTVEKVIDIFKWENVEQNPPWMEQLPLPKMKFLIPRTLPSLVETVQKEVCSHLKMTKKVEKENLLVRWAGKKRDRVDEILVRELQEEEVLWINYNQDEAVVKDQMADIILESLISDTVRVFEDIEQKRKKSSK